MAFKVSEDPLELQPYLLGNQSCCLDSTGVHVVPRPELRSFPRQPCAHGRIDQPGGQVGLPSYHFNLMEPLGWTPGKKQLDKT